MDFPIVQCLYTEYPILIIYLVIEQSYSATTPRLLHYVDLCVVYCFLSAFNKKGKFRMRVSRSYLPLSWLTTNMAVTTNAHRPKSCPIGVKKVPDIQAFSVRYQRIT